MDFREFVNKKILITFMPNMRIEGKVTGFESCYISDNDDLGLWMSIALSTDDKNLDCKTALVDCDMITCVVEME